MKPFLFPSCLLLHIPASQIIISRPYSVNALLDGYCQRCASLLLCGVLLLPQWR